MNLTKSLKKANFFRRLIGKLSSIERLILSVSLLGLCVGLLGLLFLHQKKYTLIPDKGGEFIEGIVAVSSDQVEAELKNLINFSLVRFSEKGDIIPGLVEKYEISQDAKTYTFTLRNNLDANFIADTIKNSKNGLGDSQIETKDNTIVIKLGSPYSPLLADLTDPIIPLGPYRLVKQNAKELVLTPNENFIYGKPYISQIKVKIYATNQLLLKALKRGEIFAAVNLPESIDGFNHFQLSLPKYQILFFNLDREPWKDIELRKKIIRNELVENPKKIVVTTSKSIVENNGLNYLQDKISGTKLEIEKNIVEENQLKDQIIPNRNFDTILYGIDFGRDADPYPFWHSSQIGVTGKNISGFKSKSTDKLIEESLLSPDTETRKKNYQEIQKIIDGQAPIINIYQSKVDYQIVKKISGVKMGYGITPSDRFYNVWEWYIKTKKVFSN